MYGNKFIRFSSKSILQGLNSRERKSRYRVPRRVSGLNDPNDRRRIPVTFGHAEIRTEAALATRRQNWFVNFKRQRWTIHPATQSPLIIPNHLGGSDVNSSVEKHHRSTIQRRGQMPWLKTRPNVTNERGVLKWNWRNRNDDWQDPLAKLKYTFYNIFCFCFIFFFSLFFQLWNFVNQNSWSQFNRRASTLWSDAIWCYCNDQMLRRSLHSGRLFVAMRSTFLIKKNLGMLWQIQN